MVSLKTQITGNFYSVMKHPPRLWRRRALSRRRHQANHRPNPIPGFAGDDSV